MAGSPDARDLLREAVNLPLVQQEIARLKSAPRSTYAAVGDTDHALLDQVYKRIGAKVRSIKDALQRGTAANPAGLMDELEDFVGQREILREAMVARAPSYREALARFADEKAVENAVQGGIDAMTGSKLPVEVGMAQQRVAKTPAQAEAFKRGGLAKLLERINAGNPDLGEQAPLVDVMREVFGREAGANQIRAVLGEEAYQKALPAVRQLLRETALFRGTTGGSNTADKLADALGETNVEKLLEAMALGPSKGAILAGIRGAVQPAMAGAARLVRGRTAAAEGDLLLTQGADKVRAALEQIQAIAAQRNAGGAMRRRAVGAAGRAVIGQAMAP